MPAETIEVIESNNVEVTITEANEITVIVSEGESLNITFSDSTEEVFKYNTFVATADQTVFTLRYIPRLSSQRVFRNGAYQAPNGSDYNIDSNVITFNSGLSEGEVLDVEYVKN